MKKYMILAPLVLALAACGDGGTATKAESAAAANGLAAGLWEVASEVTAFEQTDEGSPKIDTREGTTATEQICVPEGDRPPTEIFSGPDYNCSFSNYYARNGRMSHTLNCSREGLTGNIAMTVDGSFEGESFDATRQVTTYLTTDGDVRVSTRLQGRRVGDCPAEGEGEGDQ